ncbi:MAG: OmpW family outer membrane protein [Rhodospirillaceae bacterium]
MLRLSTTFGAVALATALISTSALAEEGSFRTKQAGQFNVRARVLTAIPYDKQTIKNAAGADTGLRATVTADVEPELDLSYFFTDNIALELIAGWTRHAVKANPGAIDAGTVRLLPPTLTAQYHFFTKERISPYIGAGWNYTFIFDERGGATNQNKFSNATGPALQAGVDIAITGGLSLNLDVKKIWWVSGSDFTLNNGALKGKADLDPLLVGIGVGYRF